MKTIDLNCDMGESFGHWKMGNDAEIMNYVSSANIACGFHAGDATIIRRTVETAISKNVALGAHPSYPDLPGFGRREMKCSAEEIYDFTLYQVAAVKGICETYGSSLHHVKPHGALYNSAAANPAIARSIAEAVKAIDKKLILYGLSGSHLITEAEKTGLKTASEVFADRTYKNDGNLTDRNDPNALIESPERAFEQALQMVEQHRVLSDDSEYISIKAETICIHGDGATALELVERIHRGLVENNISIAAI